MPSFIISGLCGPAGSGDSALNALAFLVCRGLGSALRGAQAALGLGLKSGYEGLIAEGAANCFGATQAVERGRVGICVDQV